MESRRVLMKDTNDMLVFTAVNANSVPQVKLRVHIKPEYYQYVMAVKSLTGMTQQDCINRLLDFAIERTEIDVFGKKIKMKDLRSDNNGFDCR